MCSRGQYIVSLCISNKNETTVAETNEETNETHNPSTSDKRNETATILHVDAEGITEAENIGSDSDNNYIPSEHESSEEEVLAKKISRWKKANPEKWKKNIIKQNRSLCKPYKVKSNIKALKHPKMVNCENCKFKCSTSFSEDERVTLCANYWKLQYERQKDFILSFVSSTKPKCRRIRTGTGNQKENSRKYYFQKNGEKIQVCKLFFLKTLSISHGPVDTALNGTNEHGLFSTPDKRGHHIPSNKTPQDMIEKVREHIKSFPTMESHYCRKTTKRQYLDPSLSISKMYDLYVDQCKENNEKYVSQITYRRTFCKEFNLSFFHPKKDLCETCEKHKKKLVTDEVYEAHIARRDEANQLKNDDKIRANEDNTFVTATFDLQSVLNIPTSDVSQMYYTRKLCAYNLTIYEAAKPNNAYCYSWTELNGQRGSCEIGTALLFWIRGLPSHVKEISLFSDSCSGQNRNQFIAALFLYIVQNMHLEVIQHNFLETGHTYMEVDSMHSAIEKAKRNVCIYTHNDLLNVFRLARSQRNKNKLSGPYNVQELRFSDFVDLKTLASNLIKNKSKDENGKKVEWLKIKCMKYEKKNPGCIFFKYKPSESEFHILRVAGRGRPAEAAKNLQPLYTTLLPITEKKKNSLLKLVRNNIIPPEYHEWYRSLPVNKRSRGDTVPEPTISDSESDMDID